jgi:hypothetical protein
MAVFNKDALVELKVLIEKELEKGLPLTEEKETLVLGEDGELTVLGAPSIEQPVVVRYQGRNYIVPW